MCMDRRIPAKDAKQIIGLIPKEGKTVYKIVGVVDGKYHPVSIHTREPFGVGAIKADTSVKIHTWDNEYKSGFHFFQTKVDAVGSLDYLNERLADRQMREKIKSNMDDMKEIVHDKYAVIECIVKKSWVTAIGVDGGSQEAITVVAKKAIFPEVK